jgi:hypothetical protein
MGQAVARRSKDRQPQGESSHLTNCGVRAGLHHSPLFAFTAPMMCTMIAQTTAAIMRGMPMIAPMMVIVRTIPRRMAIPAVIWTLRAFAAWLAHEGASVAEDEVQDQGADEAEGAAREDRGGEGAAVGRHAGGALVGGLHRGRGHAPVSRGALGRLGAG